jgi:predicted RNase H-like HicB family nuclease
MLHSFTLEFWEDDGWYVGKLKEVPNVFSQGETLEQLESNIKEVYSLMFNDDMEPPVLAQTKELMIEV